MKSKSIFISIVLSVSLVVLLLVVAFAEAAPEVLKIGNTVPMNRKEGLEIQKWLKLFAKLINEEGGWKIGAEKYKIEWISYNDEMHPEKARAAAERLIFKDNVKHIISQWGSSAILSTIKVSDPNKVLVVAGALPDEPCKPQYKYSYKGVGPIPTGCGSSGLSAQALLARGIKTAVTVNPDNAAGRARADQDNRMLPRMGIQIIDKLFFPMGTVDFGPVATKVKSLNPGVCWYGATSGEDITKLTVGLHDVGFQGGLDCDNLHPGVIKDIVAKIGPEYIERMMTAFYDAKQYQKDPEMVKYIQAYEKEYGEWNVEGILWIGSWFVFKAAVEATKSLDVDVLSNYLSNDPPPVRTLCGWQKSIARPDLDNLRTVDSINSVYKGIMKNGKLVPYKPFSCDFAYKTFVESYGIEDIYKKYWEKFGYPKFPKEEQ